MSYAKKRAEGLPLSFKFVPTPTPKEEAPRGRAYRITIRLDEVEVTFDKLGELPRETIKVITPYRKFWQNFGKFSQAEKIHVKLCRLLRELHGETLR